MPRAKIPNVTRNQLLGEYNHRCAICGADRPHIHHINEDATNNDLHNLLPLCPNCHLSDQHNPTTHIELGILQLFRKYKDPAILTPQFNALYHKFKYLLADEIIGDDESLDLQLNMLVSFVGELEMGLYYGGVIRHLAERRRRVGDEVVPLRDLDNTEYRAHLAGIRDQVLGQIMECLRFQHWLQPRGEKRAIAVITVTA